MAKKVMFQTKLTELATTDVEGLGVLRDDEFGNVYRWMRNDAATALVAGGCCLANLSSAVASVDQGVYSPDAATGGATALVHMPAGVPMTAIGATGSSTGCFGWIQVEGKRRVSLCPSATAAQQEPGCLVPATSVDKLGATHNWGRPLSGTIDSTVGGNVNLRCLTLAGLVDTVTDLATAVSAAVYIRCLP
jgi:hypothetical protein